MNPAGVHTILGPFDSSQRWSMMAAPNGSAMTCYNRSGGAGLLRWKVTSWVALFTPIAPSTTLKVRAGSSEQPGLPSWQPEGVVKPEMNVVGTRNWEMIQPGGNGEPELSSIVRVIEYFTSQAVIVSPFENLSPGRMWNV